MTTLYAPPAVPAFAGNPTPSLFDNWVQVTLGFQTQGIMFRAERHASQSLTTGNNTLDFDTILEDPYSGWNSGTFTWAAPYTGWYEVTCTGAISVSSVTTIAAQVISNGATLTGSILTTGTVFPGIATASQLVGLTAGSGVQGGINVSASSTTNTSNGRYSTLEISYVSQ